MGKKPATKERRQVSQTRQAAGRPRPADFNELAAWIVREATGDRCRECERPSGTGPKVERGEAFGARGGRLNRQDLA